MAQQKASKFNNWTKQKVPEQEQPRVNHWTKQLKDGKALTLAHLLQPYTKEQLVSLALHRHAVAPHQSFDKFIREYVVDPEMERAEHSSWLSTWRTLAIRGLSFRQSIDSDEAKAETVAQKLPNQLQIPPNGISFINNDEAKEDVCFVTFHTVKAALDAVEMIQNINFHQAKVDAKKGKDITHFKKANYREIVIDGQPAIIDFAFVPRLPKIWVGGLSQETSRNSLRRAFGHYDVVNAAVLQGKNGPYGFITFTTARDVLRALYEHPAVDGRRVTLRPAQH